MSPGRIALSLLVLAGIAYGASRIFLVDADSGQNGRQAERETEAPVIVARVEMGQSRTKLEAVGTSRALQSAAIFPAVSGEVVEVAFRAGVYVEKDDLLVALESQEEKLAVDLAEVRLADARRTFERRKELVGTGAMTKVALDEAQKLYDEARIALDQARVTLDFRFIRAPFSGYVGATDVDVGDRIGPDTEITTMDDRSALLVRFEVPESFISEMQVGMEIDVQQWRQRNGLDKGEIVDIGSRIDPQSRTFTARARVKNDDDHLRPGQSFRVVMTLLGATYPKIPEVAVLWGPTGPYVWTVVDGRSQRAEGTIVERQVGHILFNAGGIAAGDLIVVEGVQRLRPGSEVNIVEPIADQQTYSATAHSAGTGQ